MNRFFANMLLSLLGTLMAVGGCALWWCVGGADAWVGGALLMAGVSLFSFAAFLGWWKADDAENLFGAPLSRDDYMAGVAIPYAEIPLDCPLKKLESTAVEKDAQGALVLRPATGKGLIRLFPWSAQMGQPQVEVRRRGESEAEANGVAADEAEVVVCRADSPGVTPACAESWQWYGVMSGNAFPLMPDTLWYICQKASLPLKNSRACAVLFCDGQKLRVYPARRLAAVRALLKQTEVV